MQLDRELTRRLGGWAMGRQAEFLADLGELAAIDSGTHTPQGVNRVVDWLEARFKRLGWPAERLPAGEYGDCVAARAEGQGAARLLLIGHMDTVYPPGTAAARPVTVEGDVLRGPGTCDMKAGVLAAIYAVEGLRALGFDGFSRITLFCNSDEEVSSPASRALYLPLAQACDAALAFEAARANGDLVSARKGGGKYRIAVHGKAAHAGVEPEKGANAIVQLARLIDLAAALNDLRPGVTVNPGVIRGGERANVVPDYAECDLDVRALDRDGAGAIHAAIYGLAEHRTVPGTRIEVTGKFNGLPMERTPGNAWLAETATAVGAVLGLQVKDGPMTGGRGDANYLNAEGLPCLDGLGPVGGLDHSPEEYILVSSIPQRIALAAGLIAAACANVEELRQLRARS